MIRLPLPEPPDDAVVALRDQLDAARAALHDAQDVAALLDVDDAVGGDVVAVARGVIERDLAARRIDAWVAVVDRLRAEGRRRGLFT